MNAQAYAGVRTGVQFLMTWLVLHVSLFAAVPAMQQQWVIEWVTTALATAGWTWLIRWLETRKGDSPLASGARALARVLMLGFGKQQPTYSTPSTQATAQGVTYANGMLRSPLSE